MLHQRGAVRGSDCLGMNSGAHKTRPDPYTLRLVVDFVASRAHAYRQTVSADGALRDRESQALAELALDLEAIATECEVTTADALSRTAQRLSVERAVRRHLEVAVSSAMKPLM